MEPLKKRIFTFGSANANNKFRKQPDGIRLHHFKFHGCVFGNQVVETNHRRVKSKAIFQILIGHLPVLRHVDADGKGGYLAASKKMIANLASKPAAAPNFRTGDERLVKLTPSAAQKVSTLLTKQGRANGVLRVAVVGGGCSGLQYKMDLQDGPASRDILVESGGVRVVVDPKSALYVTGSELDYVEALQDGGFKVKNPNAATSCSCGESFSA